MRVIDVASDAGLAVAAADWVVERLREMPAAVLALPTGNTPLSLYARLSERVGAGAVRLDRARVFNLDEYCGLGPEDPHSFAGYMQRHVIAPLALRPAQVRLLRGDAADMGLECRAYDAALAACGGIDACVLGLGANGHVAFNEPGTSWDLTTHLVGLSESTRAAQRRPGEEFWEVPDRGVTMGIATLRQARAVLLLIAGAAKTAAADALYRGEPCLEWPVTSLAGHHALTVIHLREPARQGSQL